MSEAAQKLAKARKLTGAIALATRMAEASPSRKRNNALLELIRQREDLIKTLRPTLVSKP